MIEKNNETSNSKENTIETIKDNNDNKDIKDKIDNKLNKEIHNKKINYLLIIFIIITTGSIFIFIYFSKLKSHIICEYGLFRPEDDQKCCIKCSIENCIKYIGSKLDNICNKCYPGFYPDYKDNKIITCSYCDKGFIIDGECINYSFKAIYQSNGSEIKLINSDISKIKKMIVDGRKVNPSTHYLFDDNQNHEVFMLLDISKYNNSINSTFENIDRMISISFKPNFNTRKVTNMSSLFNGCFLLKTIDLSIFDTSNVINMDYMFGNCYSLKSLNLSNFDTSNVKKYVFHAL